MQFQSNRYMERFKIEHFENENGEGSFPICRTVTDLETGRIISELRKRLHLPEKTSIDQLGGEIAKSSELVGSVDLEESLSSFSTVMRSLGLNLSGNVYLNWGKYEAFDEISLESLLLFFDDIWYPGSDDLEIFDPNWDWVISIHHAGMVRLLRFERL